MNSQSSSNNDVYSEQTEYKDKSCIGLRCSNSKGYLYHISLTIGSSFLCADCKKSVEQIGWTLQRIEYADDKKVERQNSNRQLEIKNGDTNIKGINKDYIRSRKPLPELQQEIDN